MDRAITGQTGEMQQGFERLLMAACVVEMRMTNP